MKDDYTDLRKNIKFFIRKQNNTQSKSTAPKKNPKSKWKRITKNIMIMYYKFYLDHFSTLPRKRPRSDFPLTATTLKRTPGISPTECPFLPNPETVTSSLSFMKLRQPSRGTKAAIFFPFFLRSTLTHLRTPELGCLVSLIMGVILTLRSSRQLNPWRGRLPRRGFCNGTRS